MAKRRWDMPRVTHIVRHHAHSIVHPVTQSAVAEQCADDELVAGLIKERKGRP